MASEAGRGGSTTPLNKIALYVRSTTRDFSAAKAPLTAQTGGSTVILIANTRAVGQDCQMPFLRSAAFVVPHPCAGPLLTVAPDSVTFRSW